MRVGRIHALALQKSGFPGFEKKTFNKRRRQAIVVVILLSYTKTVLKTVENNITPLDYAADIAESLLTDSHVTADRVSVLTLLSHCC